MLPCRIWADLNLRGGGTARHAGRCDCMYFVPVGNILVLLTVGNASGRSSGSPHPALLPTSRQWFHVQDWCGDYSGGTAPDSHRIPSWLRRNSPPEVLNVWSAEYNQKTGPSVNRKYSDPRYQQAVQTPFFSAFPV